VSANAADAADEFRNCAKLSNSAGTSARQGDNYIGFGEFRMEVGTPFLCLSQKVATRNATVGICGLGYVGPPLAMAVPGGRFSVVGFDVDSDEIDEINAGRSYLASIASEQIQKYVD
jgi:UDP-glucose/GDP-mannose dehydrogenase family, NAD binding domain